MSPTSVLLLSLGALAAVAIGIELSHRPGRRTSPHARFYAQGVRRSGRCLPDADRQFQLAWG